VFVNKNSKWVEYVQEIQTLLENAGFKYLFLDTLTQKEIIQTYKSAQLVVMTPMSDGAPVSALETMAAGSPLILPPLDYDQDLFGKGVHFFKKFEASELADTMFRILNNIEKIDTNTAQKIALAKADRRTEMQKLAYIYEQFSPSSPRLL
jgi:glycosyltransferase involved in cell wall biosynthesis